MSSSTGRKNYLFYGLAALPGLLAFLSLVDLMAGKGPVAGKRELFKAIRFKRETSRPAARADDYLTIQANRFCGASSPWTPPGGKPKSGYRAVYLLRGTAIHSDPSRSLAFIEVPGVDGQKAYRVGDDVHGALLREIHPDSVVLSRGGESIEVDLCYRDLLPRKGRTGLPGREGRRGRGEALPLSGAEVDALLGRMDPARRKKILLLPPARRLRVLRNLLRKAGRGRGSGKRRNAPAWKKGGKARDPGRSGGGGRE